MGIAVTHLTTRIRSVNATDAPAIHWPSAFVGLFLAVVVVVGVSWLASPRPAESRLAIAAANGQAATAGQLATTSAVPAQIEPIVAPTPIPAVTPEAQPAVQRVRVSGTNGSGVNLRAKPGERGQRIKTLSEGTTLEVIGETQIADGLQWRNVREPGGGTGGWIAASFAAPIQ